MTTGRYVLVDAAGWYLTRANGWSMYPSRARRFRTREQADAMARQFEDVRVLDTGDDRNLND